MLTAVFTSLHGGGGVVTRTGKLQELVPAVILHNARCQRAWLNWGGWKPRVIG